MRYTASHHQCGRRVGLLFRHLLPNNRLKSTKLMGSVIWTRRGGTGAGTGWGVAWNVAPHSALMEEAEEGKGGAQKCAVVIAARTIGDILSREKRRRNKHGTRGKGRKKKARGEDLFSPAKLRVNLIVMECRWLEALPSSLLRHLRPRYCSESPSSSSSFAEGQLSFGGWVVFHAKMWGEENGKWGGRGALYCSQALLLLLHSFSHTIEMQGGGEGRGRKWALEFTGVCFFPPFLPTTTANRCRGKRVGKEGGGRRGRISCQNQALPSSPPSPLLPLFPSPFLAVSMPVSSLFPCAGWKAKEGEKKRTLTPF